jgi:DNA replication protein DnaC
VGNFNERHWGISASAVTASILDRLLHHASVVITDGNSYRMRDAQHKRGDRH